MDELTVDDVERLRLALSWMGYATPEGLETCCLRQTELMRNLIRAVLDQKKRRLESPSPASDAERRDGWNRKAFEALFRTLPTLDRTYESSGVWAQALYWDEARKRYQVLETQVAWELYCATPPAAMQEKEK